MHLARRLLAGLDVGVGGGLFVLLWYSFHSWLRGEYWWTKFNVVAGFFFGNQVFSLGFGRATLAGAALLIFLYGTAGMLAGLLIPVRSPLILRWLATFAVAAVVHLAFDRFVYPRLTPFVLVHFPMGVTATAHIWFGLNLLRYRRRFRALDSLSDE